MDQIYVTARLQKLLTQAEDEAKRLKDDYISVEHVLLGCSTTTPESCSRNSASPATA